ncbi:hypothetical protein V5799_004194, partial [Amblyomma americanum]
SPVVRQRHLFLLLLVLLLFNCAILSEPVCFLATRMPGRLPCPRHPLCFVGIDLSPKKGTPPCQVKS